MSPEVLIIAVIAGIIIFLVKNTKKQQFNGGFPLSRRRKNAK
jgi:hypothetical protein